MVSNLALFCLATYLATFSKIGQFFPKSSFHPGRLLPYSLPLDKAEKTCQGQTLKFILAFVSNEE
jgi:hypothetical protein